MLTTMIAIGGGDTLKASELADGLFDEDAKLRKRLINLTMSHSRL